MRHDEAAEVMWTIEPFSVRLGVRLAEAWRGRALIRFFMHEALQRFTRNTNAGHAWLVIRPLMAVAAHLVFFGHVLSISTGSLPYPIYFASGMVLWHFFDQAVNWPTRSLEINRKIISKMYFPRLLVPIAFLAPAMIDFAVLSTVLLLVVGWYWATTGVMHLVLGWGLLWVPIILLLTTLFAISIALWLAPSAMSSRDIIFSIRYVLHAWFLLTPVAYPEGIISGDMAWLPKLNPMAPLVTNFRAGLTGGLVEPQTLIMPLCVTMILVVTGLFYFVASDAKWIDKV
jgi:lipopolysaccharide transport system permease protein